MKEVVVLEEQKYSLAKKLSTPLLHRLLHCPPHLIPPPRSSTAQILPGPQRWEAKQLWGEGCNSCRPLGFISQEITPSFAALTQVPHVLLVPSLGALVTTTASPGTSQRHRCEGQGYQLSQYLILRHTSLHIQVLFSAGRIIVTQQRNPRTWVQVSTLQTFWPFWIQPNPTNRATHQTKHFPVWTKGLWAFQRSH